MPVQSNVEGPVLSSAAAAPGAPPADDLPAFLRFAPVPVRARRDGWTVGQFRFVLSLARGNGMVSATFRDLSTGSVELGQLGGRGRRLMRSAGRSVTLVSFDCHHRAADGLTACLKIVHKSKVVLIQINHARTRSRMVGESHKEATELEELEKSQAGLRECIEQSKRLADKSQQLLDQHKRQKDPADQA